MDAMDPSIYSEIERSKQQFLMCRGANVP